MIICGYAGIGKSYLAKNFPNVIDLESTPFEKDWERYVKCAVHYHKQGYLVLVSCHKEMRTLLCDIDKGVYYDQRITIVPDKDDQLAYIRRYLDRGNTAEFIKTQMDNWDKWLDEDTNRLLGENWIVMQKGETLYDCLVRLAEKAPCAFCNYDQCPVGGSPKQLLRECFNPLKEYVEKWKN